MAGTIQAKGSASQIVTDWEVAFKTVPVWGSRTYRRARVIPFNAIDLVQQVALNASATMRGNRNPAAPYQGNKDVSGSITIPFGWIDLGFWLCGLIGMPTSTANSNGSDVKSGAPNVTVAHDAANECKKATFTVAQTAAAVGMWFLANSEYYQLIEMIDTSNWKVAGPDGFPQSAANCSAQSVDWVRDQWWKHQYKIAATAGLPSFMVEKGFLDLDVPYWERFGGLKVGSMAFTIDNSGNELAAAVNLLGASSLPSTQRDDDGGNVTISSGTLSFADTDNYDMCVVGDIVLYTGVAGTPLKCYIQSKDGSPDVTVTKYSNSDSEAPANITATPLLALIQDGEYGGDSYLLKRSFPFDRFEPKNASIWVDGTQSDDLKAFSIDASNDLDAEGYVIGSDVRAGIPEGIARLGGSLTALFKDQTFLDYGIGVTEIPIILQIDTSGTEQLVMQFQESVIQQKSPAVAGPAGVVLDLDWQAYWSDHSGDSAIIVELVNRTPKQYSNDIS